MKIPHVVSKNTLLTYETAPASFALIGETDRLIKGEDFNWDEKLIHTLQELCVEIIGKHFQQNPILNKLPCQERNYLLEILDVELPLELVISLIDVGTQL